MKEQLSDPGLLQTQAFINGQWVDASDGAMLDITNPATGEVIASVAKSRRNRDSGSGSSGVRGDEKLAGAARKSARQYLT